MQKNPDPHFEAIFQEIEFNAKEPNERLHRLWMLHVVNVVNAKEGMQYESEEAFRLDQAFSAARYRMISLQENFRASCRRYVESEMYQQE